MKLDAATVERLAMRIHRDYLARHGPGAVRERNDDAVDTGPSAAMVAWEQLDEDLRESNRAQARDILVKVNKIGCDVQPGPDPDGFEFTPDEVEWLARAEHRRWARQRRGAGWVHGRVRDDKLHRRPELVSWRRLTEALRDKDRDAVRAIPAVLASAGLHIARRANARSA